MEENMNFNDAMLAMKAGDKLTRRAWAREDGVTTHVRLMPALEEDGVTPLAAGQYFNRFLTSGEDGSQKQEGWEPNTQDVLAEDWHRVA